MFKPIKIENFDFQLNNDKTFTSIVPKFGNAKPRILFSGMFISCLV